MFLLVHGMFVVPDYMQTFHLSSVCIVTLDKFAGSNPAEAVGFLRAEESSARLPSEGK
jgi:hypothetical protein